MKKNKHFTVSWIVTLFLSPFLVLPPAGDALVSSYQTNKEGYVKTIMEDPKSPNALETYYRWGKQATIMGYGNYVDAVYVYERILEDFPGSEYADDATFYVAYLNHYYLYDYPKAISYYKKVIDEYEKLSFSYFRDFSHPTLDDVTLAIEHLEEVVLSIESYRKVISGSDEERAADAYKRLADIYRRERNFPASIATYDEMLSKYSVDTVQAEALFQLGKMHLYDIPDFYRQPFNHSRSKKWYVDKSLHAGIGEMARIVDECPNSGVVPISLMEIAKAYLKVVVEWVDIGAEAEGAYALLGNYDKAAETLLMLIREYPRSLVVDEALFLLGHVYESEKRIPYNDPRIDRVHGMRKFEDAIHMYKKLLEDYPESEYAEEAREAIKALEAR